MTERKKAVGFIRTSTEDQTLSVKAQLKTITDHCDRHNINLVTVCTAEGVSGGAPIEDREILLDAVAQVGLLGAQLLLVAKRDRLARDVVVSAMVERLVEENGGLVMSCDGVTSDKTPEGRMLRQMLDIFSEYERQMIKARTKAALHQKRLRGEKLGGRVPFGYKVVDGKLVKSENEQEIVEKIKFWKSHNSYDRIVEMLGYYRYTMRGKPFTRSTVVRICSRGE